MSEEDGYYYEDDSDENESLRDSDEDLDFNTAAEFEDTSRQVLRELGVNAAPRPLLPACGLCRCDHPPPASDVMTKHVAPWGALAAGAVPCVYRRAAKGTQAACALGGDVGAVHPGRGRCARPATVQMVRNTGDQRIAGIWAVRCRATDAVVLAHIAEHLQSSAHMMAAQRRGPVAIVSVLVRAGTSTA